MSREQVVVGAVGSGVLPEVVAGDVRYDGLGRPVIEKTPLPANSCVGSSCWNQRLIGYKAGDKVNRLTSATTGTESDASQSQGYASDARGTSRGQCGGRDAGARAEAAFRGGWVGGGAVPSTVLRRCSRYQTGWIWDAGDQRYRYRFDWDPLDRMRWHNGPGINRVLAYTADGERIVERDLTSGVTTISLRGLDAKVLREVKLENGAYSWQKDYIYREGQLLASHGHNEPLQHYHLDHLGTPRMLSNRCGERLQRFESFPFGEAIAELPQHPEKMRLTGHQRDLNQPTTTEDDLDYMHARYYGTRMGRFLGVDRGGPKAGSPRSWNRYSYVIGNPLVLLDPFGLAEVYFSIGLQPGKAYATSDGGRKVHLPERSYELGREYAGQNVFAGQGIEVIRWRVGANASAAQFTKDVGVIRDVSVVVSHTFGSDTPNPRIVFMESSGGQTSTNLGGARIRNAVVILATCNSAPIAEKMGLTADGGQAAVAIKDSVNLTSLMGMASYLVNQLAQGVPIAQAVENTRAYFKGSGGEQLVRYGDPSVKFKKTKQTH